MSAHGITLTGYCARWASGLVVEPLGTWDSTGQETLAIESASDEWQGVITATFWGPGAETGTDMLMDGGTCIVPPEALSAPGNGTITLRCTNSAGRRISVDLAYHSAGHAQVPGSPSEPTPDLWQQYVEQVAADADRAEQASKEAAGSAEAAAESAKQAAQATADIGEAKDDALEAIQQAQDTGVQAVQTATTTGVQAIQQAHQAALDDIATDRQQALTDIETEGEKQMSAITGSGAAALEAIGRVEQTAIGQVQQAGTTQVAAVQQAGQAQQTAIEQAGQSWQQQIAATGTAELGRWAPAIWDTAPLAAEHDIYAAEGAPLRVTQQGKTEQGADPAPDNPQEIAGIDSPVTAQTSDGQTTTSISMDIGSPLYGDSSVADMVANDVPSGCDRAIVLDGSEDEGWAVYVTATSGNRAIFLQGAPDMAMDADDNAVMAYSDRLPVVLAGDTNNGSVGVGLYRGNIYIYVPGITDEEGFRTALAANPLKIWYRSTAYTEAADLHIDTVTRRWRMVELDGTEGWTKTGQTSVDEWMLDGVFAPYTIKPARSSHFAYTNIQQIGSFYINAQGSLCIRFAPGTMAAVSDLTTWLAAQKSAGTPVRVLYQLATPEEYASDPHTLPALGSLPETVKATGQSTVEYSADTKSYIDSKLQAIAAQQLNLMIGGST